MRTLVFRAVRKQNDPKSCDEAIHENGFRFTAQRRQVYDAIMARRDHPTAVEVFMRVKEKMPSISLATVYNTLETLTECGLVKHVHRDRESSRYCPNLQPHGHFFCDKCGVVFDVPQRTNAKVDEVWAVPRRAVVVHREVSFRGLCPDCASQKKLSSKLSGKQEGRKLKSRS